MRILGGIADRVDDFLDNGTTSAAGQFLCRNAHRRHPDRAGKAGLCCPPPPASTKETFAAPGSPVSTALNPREFGASAESKTANLFINPARALARKRRGFLRQGDEGFLAIRRGLESGYQAARDAFAQKFTDAISGVPDAQGNVTIKPPPRFPSSWTVTITSFEHLFTPAQRDMLERINKQDDRGTARWRLAVLIPSPSCPAKAGWMR